MMALGSERSGSASISMVAISFCSSPSGSPSWTGGDMTQCQQTHETLIKEIFCGLDDESQTDVFKEKKGCTCVFARSESWRKKWKIKMFFFKLFFFIMSPSNIKHHVMYPPHRVYFVLLGSLLGFLGHFLLMPLLFGL